MYFLRPLLSLLPFMMALSACASTPPNSPKAEKKVTPEYSDQSQYQPKPQIIKQAFSSILDESFRGQFSYINGKGSFKSCNDQQAYEVRNNQTLRDIYKKITNKAATPVYIEFSGEIAFLKKNNPSSSTNIRVDRVHHMALAKASLQCAKPTDTFNFKAKGNDPYWRINMQDNKLFFATKASNQPYTLENANFQKTQVSHLKSTNQQGDVLLLEITPGHCYMKDNKEYWGYSTKANTVFGIYSGCGEPGRLTTDQKFQGYYLSDFQGQEINLTLNSNHTLEYKEAIGTEEIIKNGFWKSNTPDAITIMLVQQAGKPIREELILKRDGLTLSSNSINKNNIATSLNAPLIFNKMDSQKVVLENEYIQIERQFTAQRISPKKEIDSEAQLAVQKYFKIHRTDPKNTRFNSVRFDLNGDGKDEVIAMLDWCSGDECEMLIFEANDKGFRFSSRVSRVKAPVTVSLSQHFSWQSLLTSNDGQSPELNFDGLSYPLHTRGAEKVHRISNSTGVILFNQGKPTTWFPIK